MFQQCSSSSSCIRTRIFRKEHYEYTVCQHSTPFVLNGSTQFFLVFSNTLLTLLWSLVAWIPPSALLSCPRKQLPSIFWQVDNVCLNFFGLFGECVCIHCFDCSLASILTNETQVSSPVTHTMWLRNPSSSLWYRPKKSQRRSHSLRFVRIYEHFRDPSCAKLVIA
jgi:hypothetical protein